MKSQVSRLTKISPRAAFQGLAVLLFVGLLGLAVVTLFVSRGPIPAQITSSPVSPEHRSTRVSEVLEIGNFVTRASDGEAYVEARYDKPEAFRQLTHIYRIEVPLAQRIAAVELQTSDDGASWTSAGETETKGPSGAFELDLRNAGAHKFWKVTVVKSGEAPDVAFGQLRFIDDTNLIRRMWVDRLWLGLIPASLLIMVCFQISLSPGRVFAATAIPVFAFALFYSLGYVDSHIIVSPDSGGYLWRTLNGSYTPTRSAGYPTILLLLSETVGLDRLAWIQLSVELGCYLAGAYLLATRFENRWVGPVLALAVLLQGSTTQFAPDVLTEALFTGGLGLFAAALGALARRPDRLAVAAAVVAIVLVVLTKAAGIVLVVPALLLMRFLPSGKRLSVSGSIVLAGLGTYSLLSASNFARTGAFTPESFAGIALAGHVGWMLDDTFMPPSDLSRRMIDAAAPVIAKRPAELARIDSIEALDRYVDVTVQDYNPVIWGQLVPIAKAELGSIEAANAYLLRLAISSIRANPVAYLRHVAAHFYGLWRDFRWALSLRTSTLYIRNAPSFVVPQLDPAFIKATERVLSPPPSDVVAKAEMISQSDVPLKYLESWTTSLIADVGPLKLGALTFVLCILFLLPGRLTYIYRTEIMIALSLNAYFGAHVLMQVSLQRYAAAGTLAVVFLAVSFAVTTFYVLRDILARGVMYASENMRKAAMRRLANPADGG